MYITFSRTTEYRVDVDADDDATLRAITEAIANAGGTGDSLAEMIETAHRYDTDAVLEALVPFADLETEDWTSTEYDVDDIQPDDEEEDDDDYDDDDDPAPVLPPIPYGGGRGRLTIA